MFRILFFLFLVLSGCKNLDLLTLYDVEVENAEGIDGFTSTEIFTTGGGDEVWGMSGKDGFCNPFSFSSYDASIDYTRIKSPNKKEIKRAVVSLIPQPPMLIGKVIEKRIIGVNTRNAR
mgnify:CR=1 FL=1